jgi:hypothetical protein
VTVNSLTTDGYPCRFLVWTALAVLRSHERSPARPAFPSRNSQVNNFAPSVLRASSPLALPVADCYLSPSYHSDTPKGELCLTCPFSCAHWANRADLFAEDVSINKLQALETCFCFLCHSLFQPAATRPEQEYCTSATPHSAKRSQGRTFGL